MQAYKELENRLKKLNSFSHIASMCFWDEACMMPAGGGDARATAMAELSVHMHELATSKDMADLIKKAEQVNDLSDWQRANLTEAKRNFQSSTCLNPDFVKEKSMINQKSEQLWRKLRPANNWEEFLPQFEKVVALSKKEAEIRADKTGLKPYDALLELYEPGFSSDRIEQLFNELKAELPELMNKVVAKQGEVKSPVGKFDTEKQRQLGVEVMNAIGFDFEHGRLDISDHPFCGGVPEDIRITTRYNEGEFVQSLMGIIHETGHARYEQCLPNDWLTQPVGVARGMGIHEGQSLLFEMQVAHSDEFISFITPKIKSYFQDADPKFDWSNESISRLINKVEKSFIRVEADEVTYPAHIILRFEIEKALIEGTMSAKDLPSAWDERMQKYLGLSTTGNFSNGCMQDVHWPAGMFGYFPSYTLGAMNAAQAFNKAQQDVPGIKEGFKSGDFTKLNQWFSEKIWSKGSFFSTDELMTQATGEPLQTKYFLNHLKTRYLNG